MSATPLSNRTRDQSSTVLLEKLALALPRGVKFGVYHLSTPPTKTDALVNAPPDERPDRTYCESHFLAISIEPRRQPEPRDKPRDVEALPSPGASKGDEVLVLALEIFIFTTAYSSIFFVSKADSTGYLHLLGLPKGTPSPIREVSTAFIGYLVEQRSRKNIQSVVNLFARAQPQYLFLGSVDNPGKHVLDDRGLVKWWCRVLNPLLEGSEVRQPKSRWSDVTGYLIVPGLDHYETRAFVPRTPASSTRWVVGHPLEEISHYCQEYDWVPPRCLIPKYPDDPKSRFRDELDEEAEKWGSWKSVKSLDQFWEMMAFRQECSSGRLTGFIWVVFRPKDTVAESIAPSSTSSQPTPSAALSTPNTSFDEPRSQPTIAPPSTPSRRKASLVPVTPKSSPKKLFGTPSASSPSPSKPERKTKKKKKALRGRIIPRQPHVKTEQRNYLADRPVSTAYYYWPPEGRGQRIVDESDFKRAVELLLRLEFETLDKAVTSTRRWANEVGMGSRWGLEVVGRREVPVSAPRGTAPQQSDACGGAIATNGVNNLSSLTKRKRASDMDADPNGRSEVLEKEPTGKVNILGAGLVRRKHNRDLEGAVTAPGVEEVAPPAAPKVNVLTAGLVRKKPKV